MMRIFPRKSFRTNRRDHAGRPRAGRSLLFLILGALFFAGTADTKSALANSSLTAPGAEYAPVTGLGPEGAGSPTAEETGGSDPEAIQASLDALKAQIESLRRQLETKQDVPDTRRKFSARVGGMLEIETVAVDQSQDNYDIYGDIQNDFGFRDVRLWVKGEGYETLSYNVTLGFTGRLTFKNVMLTARELPILGTASVGHFDVEMGMGYLESTYDYTFTEEDSVNTTFSFGRRLGVGSVHYAAGQNMRLFTGVYTGRPLSIGEGKHANENCDNVGILLNTRLTGVPVYRETADGRLDEVVHLGGAFCWAMPGKEAHTGMNRPTTLLAVPTNWLNDMPPLLYGQIDTDSYSVTGIEAAWQRKRIGLIGEGFVGNYDGYDNAYGAAATGRVLLTPGAYQKYDKSGGYFAGIAIPENMRFVDRENHTCLEGWGAWELVGQWSWTDLDTLRDAPGNVLYGCMSQYTVALNWYWNPQVRWGINWVYARPTSEFAGPEERDSSISAISCQARITF